MAQPLWKPVWRLLKNRATYDPAILLSYPEKPPNPNLKRFLHPSAHCGAIYKPSYGRKAPPSPAHPLNQTSSSLSSALTPSHITRNWHNAIQRPKTPQWNDYFRQRPRNPGLCSRPWGGLPGCQTQAGGKVSPGQPKVAAGSKDEKPVRGKLEKARELRVKGSSENVLKMRAHQASKMFSKATPSSTDWFLIWPIGGGSSTTRDSENSVGCRSLWSHRDRHGRSKPQGLSSRPAAPERH